MAGSKKLEQNLYESERLPIAIAQLTPEQEQPSSKGNGTVLLVEDNSEVAICLLP